MHFGKPLIHAAEYGDRTVAGGTQACLAGRTSGRLDEA
jgi:hypothetical protein